MTVDKLTSTMPVVNATSTVIHSLQLLYNTKDALHVSWDVDESFAANIQGYLVRYQAEGSKIVQFSPTLSPSKMDEIIAPLHENTEYEVCVRVLHNLTSKVNEPCIVASTSVDSLHVALGSTFGAFLALGIIVFFVFAAKWNHTRKLKKQLRDEIPSGFIQDAMSKPDGELEMSDVSLNVNSETNTHPEFSSIGSRTSRSNSKKHTENGSVARRMSQDGDADEDDPDDIEGAVGGHVATPTGSAEMHPVDEDEATARTSLIEHSPPATRPSNIHNDSIKHKKRASRDYIKLPQNNTSFSEGNTPPKSPQSLPEEGISSETGDSGSDHEPKKDYGGARPKEYSVIAKSPKTSGATS